MKQFISLFSLVILFQLDAKQVTLDLAPLEAGVETGNHDLLCALRMLRWSAVNTSIEDLRTQSNGKLAPNEFGITLTPLQIRNLLEGYRLSCSLKRHADLIDLRSAINQGTPVLVLCQADGIGDKPITLEWRIVFGYETATQSVHFLDARGDTHIAIESAFREQWHFSPETPTANLLHRYGIAAGSMVWIRRQDAVEYAVPIMDSDWPDLRTAPDAIARHPSEAVVFFFLGENYFSFDIQDKLMTGPTRIETDWTGLPTPIDAAINHPNGKVYFFSGEHYYRFSFKTSQVDKVGSIGIDGWRGLEPGIEAGLIHPNNKAYFFKGTNYFRFSFKSDRVDKLATIGQDGWRGVPKDLSSAFLHSDGRAYLFKDSTCFNYKF